MPAPANAAEEVIVHLLKTNEAVSELVKTGDDHRICPDQLPMGWKGKTSIVYEQQSDRRQRVVSGAETGLRHPAFSVYCIDRNRGTSRVLATAVRDALTVNGSTVIAGVNVRQVFVKDGERDESLPGADGQDPPERYRTLDVVVHYRT